MALTLTSHKVTYYQDASQLLDNISLDGDNDKQDHQPTTPPFIPPIRTTRSVIPYPAFVSSYSQRPLSTLPKAELEARAVHEAVQQSQDIVADEASRHFHRDDDTSISFIRLPTHQHQHLQRPFSPLTLPLSPSTLSHKGTLETMLNSKQCRLSLGSTGISTTHQSKPIHLTPNSDTDMPPNPKETMRQFEQVLDDLSQQDDNFQPEISIYDLLTIRDHWYRVIQDDIQDLPQPVAYYSRLLTYRERDFSATKCEATSMHDAIMHWVPLLNNGIPFTVIVDHHALVYLIAALVTL
jgi:hypothetical protein